MKITVEAKKGFVLLSVLIEKEFSLNVEIAPQSAVRFGIAFIRQALRCWLRMPR
jgi:hypothetical protein